MSSRSHLANAVHVVVHLRLQSIDARSGLFKRVFSPEIGDAINTSLTADVNSFPAVMIGGLTTASTG